MTIKYHVYEKLVCAHSGLLCLIVTGTWNTGHDDDAASPLFLIRSLSHSFSFSAVLVVVKL